MCSQCTSTTTIPQTSWTIGTGPLARKPVDENDLWRKAEQATQCTCGLNFAGYAASWAVQHTKSCTVTKAFDILFADAVREAVK
jgi:hypothetical protein